MAFTRFKKWLNRHGISAPGKGSGGEDKTGQKQGEAGSDFAVLHNRFRMFLTAWNRFQEVETRIEYTLCCDHPFGIYKVRALCTDVALQVFSCIRQLERISPKHCKELRARFAILQKDVAALVYEREAAIEGPLVLSLADSRLASDERLGGPAIARFGKLSRDMQDLLPSGFVITAAGCHRVLGQKALLDEINRRIQAGGGLKPKRLPGLAEGIMGLIQDTALPGDLSAAIMEALRRVRRECQGKGAMRLLFMGRLWPSGTKDEADGLVYWGPSLPLDAPDEDVAAAVRKTLALKRSAQAMVYRRARGLTESVTGVCIACMAVPEGSTGGVAHTANPLQPTSSHVHLYACHGLPEEMEYSLKPVDVFFVSPKAPWPIRSRRLHKSDCVPPISDAQASRIAETAVSLMQESGKPQSLTWIAAPDGTLFMALVHTLRVRSKRQEAPVHRDLLGLGTGISGAEIQGAVYGGGALSEVPASQVTDEDAAMPEEDEHDGTLPLPLMTGGSPANPGIAAGHPVVARSWDDLRNIPPHAILVVGKDDYQWAALTDRVAGIICEEGLLGSRLASLCREFGIPAIFDLKDAMEKLAGETWITMSAGNGCVYRGLQNSLAERMNPVIDYMPTSPVYRILQKSATHILPLTLVADSADFKAANCRTYHDIVRYCHDRAISAMFTLGSGKSEAPERVRQLFDGVLKQFWVINLNDGFAATPRTPAIDIKDITSVPMQALWHGMNAYPWEGPPPVDGKGLLSVFFEATANPNLEPAAQTEYFTEKNYFLVTKNYVSLYSRFGFHFVSSEARVGVRRAENYVSFTLRGGAADIERRILRVNFVGDILWEFGFQPEIHNDSLTARLEGMDMEEGKALLKVAGYLTIHTRQMDMIMQDQVQCAQRKKTMLEQCRILFTGKK